MSRGKLFISFFLVLGIAALGGFVVWRFSPVTVPGLNLTSSDPTPKYELTIRNESSQLEVIRNPLASFPNQEIKEILDFNGVSKVVFVITDTPQVQKSVWEENGEKLEYSSYEIFQPNNDQFEVHLYLNQELFRKYNWSDQNIARYINFALYTALFFRADKSQGSFSPGDRARTLIESERILLFTFEDV